MRTPQDQTTPALGLTRFDGHLVRGGIGRFEERRQAGEQANKPVSLPGGERSKPRKRSSRWEGKGALY